ncbi:MAG: DUF120 domain-containing protein [Candidatus Hadarchaeales archaeon]
MVRLKIDGEHLSTGWTMDPEDIMVLIELAREGPGETRCSLSRLAERMKISKQTASRRLASLEKAGMIKRKVSPSGQTVGVTSSGFAAIRSLHRELGKILKASGGPVELRGRVTTGFGEGKYYLSRDGYIRQYWKLGFKPYPGTLDIKLDEKSLAIREILLRNPSDRLDGFRTSEREFGPVKFFRGRLEGRDVAIIFPERTHHSDVVEVVAPVNLRKALGLSDGSAVTVVVDI